MERKRRRLIFNVDQRPPAGRKMRCRDGDCWHRLATASWSRSTAASSIAEAAAEAVGAMITSLPVMPYAEAPQGIAGRRQSGSWCRRGAVRS